MEDFYEEENKIYEENSTVKIYPIFILRILRKKIHLLKRIINQ